MFTLLKCISLLALGWSTFGITIHKECMPKTSYDITWEGSYIEVSFWLSEELIGVDLPYVDAPLWFQLQFLGKSMPDDYDRIWITPSAGVVERIRQKTKTITNETYNESLKAGWNTLVFSASFMITVRLKTASSSIPLVSSPLDLTLDKLEVRGNNVTVNCYHQSLIWQLDSGKKLTIPLPKKQQEHHLSIYSNQPSRPLVYLASQDGIQLGWDGSNLADQTVYKFELQSPVPASAEHNITILCKEKSCDVLAGASNKNIKSVSVNEIPSSISFRGALSDKIFVTYYHPALIKTSFNEQALDPGEDDSSINSELIFGVVAIIVAVLAIVALIIFVDRKKVKNVMNGDSPWETVELIISPSDPEDIDILRAIERDDVEAFESLTAKKNDLWKYEIEAHYLGKEKVIKSIMKKNNQSSGSIPSNKIIMDVLKRHEAATKNIFEAAKKGYYSGSIGVKATLENNHLPGCIIDCNGRSILHHMANFNGDSPVWQKDDIINFLNRKDYFINAADHEGNTVLHMFAHNSQKDIPVLREIVQEFKLRGANPQLKNKEGSTSVALAKREGKMELAKLLEEEQIIPSSVINGEDVTTEYFEQFVKAAGEGNIEHMQQYLLKGLPQLPMLASKNPLVEAIRSNKRESVFLLLSAGAPICNRSIADLTPLEAAHNTVDLPAFYAAIMRKAFCDRLTFEEKMHGLSKDLLKIIADHKKNIRKEGKETEGIQPIPKRKDIESYSKDVRKLLVEAAQKGLLLTCLLLAQRDTYLHRLPEEKSPFEEAHKYHHHEILVALCRDVGMVPYVHESSGELPQDLLEDKYQSDVKTLKSAHGKCYKSKVLSESLITNFENYAEPLSKETVNCNEFLYLLAKLDLVAALHRIITQGDNFDINKVVEDFSKSTMLHVAAMNGSIQVIEYLIHSNASLEKLTIGNFTAAHLAAIGGHKECFHFIISRMKVQDISKKLIDLKCDLDLRAKDLMNKYEELCKECSLPLITHEDALCVKNEIREDDKTFEILKRKGKQKHIQSVQDLINLAQHTNDEGDSKAVKIRETTKKATEKLFGNEAFIKGELLANGPLIERNEVLEISHIDFIYQLSDEAYDSGVSINDEECKEETKSGDVEKELKSQESQEIKSKAIETLTQIFPEHVKEALKKYKDNSEFVLAPPFLEIVPKGVNIRWIWKMDNGKIKLLTTYIVPVVKLPDENHYFYDGRHKKLFKSSHVDDTSYFSNLEGVDKQGWLICRLLRKLTQPCWWSPSFKTQYYPDGWHTWAVGVEGLSETKLKGFFKDNWEKGEKGGPLQDRIKNLYVKTSENLESNEKLFVQGILKYLFSLAKEEWVPKVKK